MLDDIVCFGINVKVLMFQISHLRFWSWLENFGDATICLVIVQCVTEQLADTEARYVCLVLINIFHEMPGIFSSFICTYLYFCGYFCNLL